MLKDFQDAVHKDGFRPFDGEYNVKWRFEGKGSSFIQVHGEAHDQPENVRILFYQSKGMLTEPLITLLIRDGVYCTLQDVVTRDKCSLPLTSAIKNLPRAATS